MAKPINVSVLLHINIHRHNGADDDACEVTMGSNPIVSMPQNEVGPYIKNWIRNTLPGLIKSRTDFNVEAA